MTEAEANKLIAQRKLRTKGGYIVRKIVVAMSLDHRTLFEVYVEDIPWCLVTVYADNGRADDDSEDDVDLDYTNID